MKEINMKTGNEIAVDVPNQISDSTVLTYLQTKNIDWEYVEALKQLTQFNDNILSGWLNISVKTFRSYKQEDIKFSAILKEHILLLISLIKQGISVFGSIKDFEVWLNNRNFHFENESPISYLNTISGIRYVNDRLTAIEYGDNV